MPTSTKHNVLQESDFYRVCDVMRCVVRCGKKAEEMEGMKQKHLPR